MEYIACHSHPVLYTGDIPIKASFAVSLYFTNHGPIMISFYPVYLQCVCCFPWLEDHYYPPEVTRREYLGLGVLLLQYLHLVTQMHFECEHSEVVNKKHFGVVTHATIRLAITLPSALWALASIMALGRIVTLMNTASSVFLIILFMIMSYLVKLIQIRICSLELNEGIS